MLTAPRPVGSQWSQRSHAGRKKRRKGGRDGSGGAWNRRVPPPLTRFFHQLHVEWGRSPGNQRAGCGRGQGARAAAWGAAPRPLPRPHPRPLCSRPPFLQRRLHEGGGCRLWSLLRRQGLGAGRALGEGVLINPAGRSGARAAARPPWDPSFLSQTG